MITTELATILAEGALSKVQQRMRFSECWEQGVNDVAAAILAAVEAEATKTDSTPTYYGD